MNSRNSVYVPTATALVLEWLVIFIVITAALFVDRMAVYILAGVIIATRQHAIMMLYHDAVHGLVADNRRFNDLVINMLVGVPLLIPVHVYRALHISHHKHVGTPKDPERLLLYWGQPWHYRPLKSGGLLLQLLGDVSGFNTLVMMLRYMLVRNDGELDLPATRPYPELPLLFAVLVIAIAFSLYAWPDEAITVLLLWYVPYLTLTQLLQKLRSFAEHSLGEGDSCTFDWRPGLLGRLTIWPYNINFHRVHHAHQGIPWNQLPLHADAERTRLGTELVSHIWEG